MIVTEEEALKAIECPETFDKDSGSFLCYCLASRCMAWRWADDNSGPRDADDPRKGFCGKAGFPIEIL